MLVGEGAVGANVTLGADGLRRQTTRCADVFCETESCRIDAKEVRGGILEEGFCVDGSSEVHVEVGAFGHAGEKSTKLQRVLLRGAESAGGALFLAALGCLGGGCLSGSDSDKAEEDGRNEALGTTQHG